MYVAQCTAHLSFLRFHVRDDESLLVNRAGGMSDAPRSETVQFLPFPVAPRLLHDV